MLSEKTRIIAVFDRIIIFSICAVAYFLPISKALVESFSGLAILFFLIKKLALKSDVDRAPVQAAVFIYLIYCFVSVFLSINAKISIRTFFGKTLQEILFFFAIADTLSTGRRMRYVVTTLLISSALLGIDGIQQYFTHIDFIRHQLSLGMTRIYATFSTPNDFGCYLATVLPYAVTLSFSVFKSNKVKWSIWSLSALLFVCLILTVSRGAWFGVIASLFFISLWIRIAGLFFLIIFLAIILGQPLYGHLLRERISNFFIFSDQSSIDRKIIWNTAWKMFLSNPLLGLGIGTFMFNFDRFSNGGYKFGVPYAHNCYLQIASELGIVGLLLFLFILLAFIWYGVAGLRRGKKTLSWYLLLASLAAIIAYSIQMTVDTILYSLDLGMLFWFVLGLGTAALKANRKGV